MTIRRLLAILPLLFAAVSLEAQVNQLTPGRLSTTVIPEVLAAELFNGPDGFFFDVPEGAVRVEVQLATSPPEANVNLFVRHDVDVVRAPDGSIVADYRSLNPGGSERVEFGEMSSPPLEPGRYYVALEAGFRNPQTFGFLQVEIELTAGAGDLDIIASDDFENFNPNGWTRNYPEPVPAVDGSTLGSPGASLEVRRGPRNLTRNLQLTGIEQDYFVAPPKYLGDLSLLGPTARLEFDIAYTAPEDAGPATRSVEVRIIGATSGSASTFRWVGAIPDRNPRRFIAPLEPSAWQRLAGQARFEEALQNVLRIEIFAVYGEPGGIAHLDNVFLLGDPQPPSATISDFEIDLDGWTPNTPATPLIAPRILGITKGDDRTARSGIARLATDGNPGGYLLIRDIEDQLRDYMVAPRKFLGDYLALGPEARLEVDRRHTSVSGAVRGVEVRLIGYGAAYASIASAPSSEWKRYSFGFQPENWVAVAGDKTFEEVLRGVQRIEISVDEAAGAEESGLDNVRLVVPPPVIPMLSTAPESLVFNSVQADPPPPSQTLRLSANVSGVEWIAAPSASAPWIELAEDRGRAPSDLVVRVNPSGLPIGVHRGTVEIAWIGSTQTLRIPVTLNLVSPTGPLISRGGVVNAATFRANSEPNGELTGGEFVAVFGSRLAGLTLRASTIPLPTELGGVRVTIGGIPATLVFVSPLQIVAVVPQALTQSTLPVQGVSNADVIVLRDGEASPPERIRLAPLRPRLFSQDQTGSGPGAVLNILGAGQIQLNTENDPVRPGQLISIYGAGLGPTQTPVPDGQAATGLNPVRGAVRVSIAGFDAQVQFAGLSPNSPHLYQVNAQVPAVVAPSCAAPLTVAVDGVVSNQVTIAVSANGEPCR